MDRLKADQPIIHQPADPDAPAELPDDEPDAHDAPPRATLPITPFGDAKPADQS